MICQRCFLETYPTEEVITLENGGTVHVRCRGKVVTDVSRICSPQHETEMLSVCLEAGATPRNRKERRLAKKRRKNR
jgi:hypothetical protein